MASSAYAAWDAAEEADIDASASQEELIGRARFISRDNEEEGEGEGEEEEEEVEVFSTPPLTHQDPQSQGEEVIVMCSIPFTQPDPTPPPAPAPAPAPSPPSDSKSRRPERVKLKPRKKVCKRKRVCKRKVRRANKIRSPTPSRSPELDPLARAVLMIPTAPSTITGGEDILEVARSRGIF